MKCDNCGYEEGLHHYETRQCPDGGEAPEWKQQRWLETTFSIKCSKCPRKWTDEDMESEISISGWAALKFTSPDEVYAYKNRRMAALKGEGK